MAKGRAAATESYAFFCKALVIIGSLPTSWVEVHTIGTSCTFHTWFASAGSSAGLETRAAPPRRRSGHSAGWVSRDPRRLSTLVADSRGPALIACHLAWKA